jgi:Domain of unknown function (DUF4365)
MRPRLDLQLKATTILRGDESKFKFPLSTKNYNDLRVETQTPRLLVILDMPRLETEWITVTLESLILRKSAYWQSLQGAPETDNTKTVTVEIPKSQIFDVNGLRNLMERSRQGAVE